MDSTVNEPMVLASASSYEELSDNYDEFFNPDSWCPLSLGVCCEDGVVSFYLLSEDKEWVSLDGSSATDSADSDDSKGEEVKEVYEKDGEDNLEKTGDDE